MERNVPSVQDEAANIPKYVFQQEPSTFVNPEEYGRALLSAFQFSQLQAPAHSSAGAPAPFGLAYKNEEAGKQINPFPMEPTQERYELSNTDNTALQQHVGADLPLPSSNANLDALSRQIMIAGMAALGMTNPTSQKQFIIDENNASSSNPVVNPYTSSTTSMQKSLVPDGSGLLSYRAPEIESFVFDWNTGYRFDPITGLHYDANTGFFINVALKIFMRWDPISNTYLRENKRPGPPQNVEKLNSQPVVPNLQSILGSLYSSDVIQKLTAYSDNTLLGPKMLSNQVGKSQVHHDRSVRNALWQQMRSLNNEGDYSKINQDPDSTSEISDAEKKYKAGAPKRTNRRSNSPSSVSNSQVTHRAREGLGRRSRSRSNSSRKGSRGGSGNRKIVSRGRSKSHSREAEPRSKPRINESRKGRRSRSRGATRSRSRGRRRSCSQSPNVRGRRSRSGSDERRNKRNYRVRQERSPSIEAKKKTDLCSRLDSLSSPKHNIRSDQITPEGHNPNTQDKDPTSNSSYGPNMAEVLPSSSGLRSDSQMASSSKPYEKNLLDVVGCFNCGEAGHLEEDCIGSDTEMKIKSSAREKDRQDLVGCFRCGNLGHYIEDCREPGKHYVSHKTTNIGATFCPDTVNIEMKCFRCGKYGHKKEECEVEGIFCYGCHEISDHIGVNCPLRLARKNQNSDLKYDKNKPKGQKEKAGLTNQLSTHSPARTGRRLLKTAKNGSSLAGNSLKKSLKCFKCGILGHIKEECKEEGTFCLSCGEICDHIAANCPLRLARKNQNSDLKYDKNKQKCEKRKLKLRCFKCRLLGHTAEECKEEGRFCLSCREMCDHIAADCPLTLARKYQNSDLKCDENNPKCEKRKAGPRNHLKLRCFKCWLFGHTAEECEEEGRFCLSCHKMCDHIAANCPLRFTHKNQSADQRDEKAGVQNLPSTSSTDQSGGRLLIKGQKSSSLGKKPGTKPRVCTKCRRPGHTKFECKEGTYCNVCRKVTNHVGANCPIDTDPVHEQNVHLDDSKKTLVSYSSDSDVSDHMYEPDAKRTHYTFKREYENQYSLTGMGKKYHSCQKLQDKQIYGQQ